MSPRSTSHISLLVAHTPSLAHPTGSIPSELQPKEDRDASVLTLTSHHTSCSTTGVVFFYVLTTWVILYSTVHGTFALENKTKSHTTQLPPFGTPFRRMDCLAVVYIAEKKGDIARFCHPACLSRAKVMSSPSLQRSNSVVPRAKRQPVVLAVHITWQL